MNGFNLWDYMQELQLRSAQQSMVISTHHPIMIIGGAEDKVNARDILTTFFKAAGGPNSVIGVIPCASREPIVVGSRYLQIFEEMGATQIHILDIRQAQEANDPNWLEILSQCTGVFVTGGDQVRLCELIARSQLIDQIKTRVQQGQLILAGTSAGAAMMGQKMIAGGSSGESPNQALVDLTEGLGIIPELLVDQHFHNRNRMARLMSAIAAYPDRLGIGIDEDTCAALKGDGTFQVLGNGTITVIDPEQLSDTNYADASPTTPLSLHNLRVHILSKGDRYDYKNRIVLQD